MYKRILPLVAVLLIISAILAACGDATPTNSTAATTAATATTAAASTTAATGTTAAAATLPPGAKAVKAGPDSKESTLLKTVVPNITATQDALKKGDVAAAKKAFAEYSYAWNGVEVYVNARSKALYDTIEVQNEFKANDLFAKADSKADAIIPYVDGVKKGFDDAMSMAATGADYDAILDEIADIRIPRSNLRKSIAALTASDVPGARTAFENFNKGWTTAQNSIQSRSKELFKETQKSVTKVTTLFASDKATAANLSAAENALLLVYNRALNVLNAVRTTGKAPTKEVNLMNAVPASISATLTALKAGDVKTAKATFQDYIYGWSGIEVYVKTRSAQLYDTIEVQNEAKADKLFENPNANPQEIIPFVEGVQKGYTDALASATSGQPLNPLLDEIADVRILRVSLTKATISLKANDLETAKAAFEDFKAGWADIAPSISSRNALAATDIETKTTKVDTMLKASSAVASEVSPVADDLRTTYNNGLKVLTDALAAAK